MGVGWVEEGKGGKIGTTVITIRINVIYKMISKLQVDMNHLWSGYWEACLTQGEMGFWEG